MTLKKIALATAKILVVVFVVFSLLFFLLKTRKGEETFSAYSAKVANNFLTATTELKPLSYFKSWGKVELEDTSKEAFARYQLIILAKSLDQYFKTLLYNTKKNLLNESLYQVALGDKNFYNYQEIKKQAKRYLQSNPDLLELSVYKLDGKKLISLRYKKLLEYDLSAALIKKVVENENLLLQHHKTDNLILLSLVKGKSPNQEENTPLLLLSQTVDTKFFQRILSHLEMKQELFYLKAKSGEVILDNYSAYAARQQAKNSVPAFQFYNGLVERAEHNLRIKLDNIEYTVGTIVEKNNLWGNLTVLLFLVFSFAVTFLLANWCWKTALELYSLVKKEIAAPLAKRRERKRANEVEAVAREGAEQEQSHEKVALPLGGRFETGSIPLTPSFSVKNTSPGTFAVKKEEA